LKALDTPVEATLIFILHRGSEYNSELAYIFSSSCIHEVRELEHQTSLEKGIFLAPPDYHLLLDEQYEICLDLSEKVNYSRPSIDVTFEAFSYILKDKLNVAILSGSNGDGAFGVRKVLDRGGKTIVIHPDEAEFKVMPIKTIEANKGKCEVLRLQELIQRIKKEIT